MAFFAFMLLVVGVLLVAGGVSFGASYAANRNTLDRDSTASLKAELRASKQEALIAKKALNRIVGGAGNPILEAGDALDLINNNDIKELN
jgi:hypothetical protein